MKSHLAYLWLLAGLNAAPDARGLLVSLRDDEGAALATLQSISSAECGLLKTDAVTLAEQGRLNILHFWPGYVPPEEFMHNIVVRLDFHPGLCVVNGIDHISARMPLCAALDIFVPALVQLLSGENVTSVFAATEEEKGVLRSLGLLPMSDLVLRFSEIREREDVMKYGVPQDAEQMAYIAAERVPAGGIGGRRGLLHRDGQSGCLKFGVAER